MGRTWHPTIAGKNRKLLLATFGYAGAASSMLFLVVPAVPLASILVIVGVVCLGCSFVVLNSYLPLLVANHPTITGCEFSRAGPDDESDVELAEHASASADAGVFPDQRPSGSVSGLPEMQLSTDISSRGVGLGYVAAVCMQVVSILVLFVLSKTSVGQAAKSLPMRIVLLNVGVSWAAGTYLSSRWLRDRPGPPLAHLTSPRIQKGRVGTTLALVKAAWQQLWATVKMAAQLRQMVVFLVAWFLLSDAIATVSSTAILFAKNELKMSTVQIALMSITAIGSGIVGAFAWPRLAARYGWSSSGTIVVCVVCFEAIPLYGMLGYVPFVRRWGVLGLQQIWEIYPMAFLHGFVLGGLSSYCRSFYGQLIPPGHEAAFYALYAFTDKGSSVIGPAVVGAVIDATGAIRLGFAFLSVLVVAPVPFLMRLRPADGRADALALARRLKATRGADRATRRRDEDDDGNSSEEIEELLGEAHY
ncbi:Autophagy protein 22 [Ascosphaera acerosa]|nr:Autophagy protein 22 [Ascosphaera acerosa]